MGDERRATRGESLTIDTIFFKATLLPGSLAVLSIPTPLVAKCAWWLLREYGRSCPTQTSFSSLVMDDDGLSVVCNQDWIPVIKFLLRPEEFTLSECAWRAVVIRSTGAADDVPGAVYCLANALSSQGLSILHMSTFESEVFLVQERCVGVVVRILREFEDPQKATVLLEEACQESNLRVASSSHLSATATAEVSHTSLEDAEQPYDDSQVKLDMSWLTPQAKAAEIVLDPPPPPNPSAPPPIKAEGLKLCILPQPLILARMHNCEQNWGECARLLTQLLLFDERFNPLEKLVQDASSAQLASLSWRPPAQTASASFMWGIWQQGDEVTLLMEEDDIYSFPNHVMSRLPQRWRVAKLCGRAIAFNETGVVTAMSRIETSIPSLNISTTTTNCTLVPDELLERTVSRLAEAFACPVHHCS